MPPFAGPADLAPLDDWIAQIVALYQREVTIRAGEHACLRDLRAAGVIR